MSIIKISKNIILLLVIFLYPLLVKAEMVAPNFKITSDVIGSFGSKESSTSFELGDTGGEVGTGDSSSTNFNLSAGFWAAAGDDAVLIFNITDAIADLGVLISSTAKSDTATFNAATTAQGGYVIQFSGNTLAFESNQIDPLAGGGASNPGDEQFGFNLVANSTPIVGSDPLGGYGQASTGYNTQNSFKFSSGDSIAETSRPSGQTLYTLSFIGNVDNSSDAGIYASNITVVATGRY
jgi:hypothetical protein